MMEQGPLARSKAHLQTACHPFLYIWGVGMEHNRVVGISHCDTTGKFAFPISKCIQTHNSKHILKCSQVGVTEAARSFPERGNLRVAEGARGIYLIRTWKLPGPLKRKLPALSSFGHPCSPKGTSLPHCTLFSSGRFGAFSRG